MSKKQHVSVELVGLFFNKEKGLVFADANHNDWVEIIKTPARFWRSKTDRRVSGLVGSNNFKTDGFCFGVYDPTDALHIVNLVDVLKRYFMAEFREFEKRIGNELFRVEYLPTMKKVVLKDCLKSKIIGCYNPNAEGLEQLVMAFFNNARPYLELQ